MSEVRCVSDLVCLVVGSGETSASQWDLKAIIVVEVCFPIALRDTSSYILYPGKRSSAHINKMTQTCNCDLLCPLFLARLEVTRPPPSPLSTLLGGYNYPILQPCCQKCGLTAKY